MRGNAAAGIILLLLAAGLIVVGASPKTKEIFGLIFGGASTAPQNIGDKYLEDNLEAPKEKESGSPYDPKSENQSAYGFVGEKGANAIG